MTQSPFLPLVESLNDPIREVRLESLGRLMDAVRRGTLDAPARGNAVNNHIHTTYSFSPYSPTRAVWEAYRAGLRSAGIMDHESICGAREFIEAGKITGVATTIGIECRVDFSDTRLRGKRINNPDQLGNAYISLHGIPHNQIDAFRAYFEPLILARDRRNRLMTDRINSIIRPAAGFSIDYEQDVLPLSNFRDGGTVTERHLLFALVHQLTQRFGRGEAVLGLVTGSLGLLLDTKAKDLMRDAANPFYDYDLLGILKKEMIGSFYVPATDECPGVADVLAFAGTRGCICAYPYLGDVADSVTGDKRPQKFEDDILDELIALVKELGFTAVSYMPLRNSPAQLSRIMTLCSRYGLLQISGEDINSPRQSFVCAAMRDSRFGHLVDATWALIGHEKAATGNLSDGFFSTTTVSKHPDLNERIQHFKAIGLSA
jgi:hypothetical protein